MPGVACVVRPQSYPSLQAHLSDPHHPPPQDQTFPHPRISLNPSRSARPHRNTAGFDLLAAMKGLLGLNRGTQRGADGVTLPGCWARGRGWVSLPRQLMVPRPHSRSSAGAAAGDQGWPDPFLPSRGGLGSRRACNRTPVRPRRGGVVRCRESGSPRPVRDAAAFPPPRSPAGGR